MPSLKIVNQKIAAQKLIPVRKKTLRHMEKAGATERMEVPAIIRYQAQTEEGLRALVPEKIETLLRQYFGFQPMPFHLELLQLMFKGGKYVVNWPTDHAKSMCSSFWFPILSLMNDPNQAHIICGANIYDSRSRVDAVRAALSPGGYLAEGIPNHHLLRDFPWIAKPKDKSRKWTAGEINVDGRETSNRNPSLYATTIQAQDIRGRRGKLILDDVEGMKHRHSESERNKLYEKIQLEGGRCYEDANESRRPLLACLGTPFDVESIYFRLEGLGWEVRRQAYKYWRCNDVRGCCEGDPERARQNDHGHLIWPAKREKIQELRRNWTELEFSIAMKMDPKGGDTSILSYEEIAQLAREAEIDWSAPAVTCQRCSGSGMTYDMQRGRVMWVRCPDCNGQKHSAEPITLVCLDPASGGRTRTSDYAGIAVIRLIWAYGDQLPSVEVLEAHPFREGIFEQIKKSAYLAQSYRCEIVYESNSQQGNNYDQVFSHLEGTGAIPEVKRHRFYTTGKNKWDEKLDVTILKTLLRDKRLMVPESRQQDEGIKALIREIRNVGTNKGDDHIAMAIWMGIRWTYENTRIARASNLKNPYAPGMARSYFWRGRRFGLER